MLVQVDKKLSMSDIAERIDREFNDELHCIFSDDNADKLILRVLAILRCPALQSSSQIVTLPGCHIWHDAAALPPAHIRTPHLCWSQSYPLTCASSDGPPITPHGDPFVSLMCFCPRSCAS